MPIDRRPFGNKLAHENGKELLAELAKKTPDMAKLKRLVTTANLKLVDGFGNTALMLASGKDYVELMKQMVGKGAVLDQQDRNGNSVVHFILRGGSQQAVDFVLENRGNIFLPNTAGSTPVDFARGERTDEEIEKIKEKYVYLDPVNVKHRAITKHINEQGVRISKDLEAPSKAQFRPRPRH